MISLNYDVWIDREEQWPDGELDPPDQTVVAMSHEAAAEKFAARHVHIAAEWDAHLIVRCVEDDTFRKIHVMKTWCASESLVTTLDILRAP